MGSGNQALLPFPPLQWMLALFSVIAAWRSSVYLDRALVEPFCEHANGPWIDWSALFMGIVLLYACLWSAATALELILEQRAPEGRG